MGVYVSGDESLCETEALQTVDDPRRVRGVAFPVLGERSHRSADVLVKSWPVETT
jgi:hypothetical protein